MLLTVLQNLRAWNEHTKHTLGLCSKPWRTSWVMGGRSTKLESAKKCCEMLPLEHNMVLHTLPNSSCGYLHKTWTRLGQLKLQITDCGETTKVLPLDTELWKINSYWQWGGEDMGSRDHCCSEVILGKLPISGAWPCAYVYMDVTNCTLWVIYFINWTWNWKKTS